MDISGDLELNVNLTKEKLYEICSDIFDKAMIFVERALDTAQLTSNQIEHVVKISSLKIVLSDIGKSKI